MKSSLHIFLAALSFLASATCLADEIRPLEVAVAWYPIEPHRTQDGERVMTLLLKHGIRAVSSVYDSVTVTVSAHDAERAREIISHGIADGYLHVMLLPASSKPE